MAVESANLLVRALDLIGTFVFALSGAALGVQRGLDLFGILVLAFVTAAVGGITRDVLIGAIPPASIASWHALALSCLGGLLVFQFSDLVTRFKRSVLLFDAAGLGVFAVAGTTKALDHGIDWPMAAVLGMLSGIGGGIVRDTLTAQVPTVLRAEIYGLAALAGALTVVAGSACGLPATPVGLTGIALCIVLRLMALFKGWKLPSPRALPNDKADRERVDW